MNSAYVPLTVHDYPRRANLYVNFTQIVHHDHTPQLQLLKERMYVETILATHLHHALHSAFPYIYYGEEPFGPESGPTHVRTVRLHCDWVHAHAKYSSDALPVKQITFPAQV